MKTGIVILASAVAIAGQPRQTVQGQTPPGTRVASQSNVVFGMYSGLALLMDVYRPEKPNGRGVILIAGSGWSAPLGYSAVPLKDDRQASIFGGLLLQAGYTVFVINHRAVPTFLYPAAVEDVQRAVRFIRSNAQGYGIERDRIGAFGSSSGGHLAAMLGVLDGRGDPLDSDAVNRESAKVQCVVTQAAPLDLLNGYAVRGAWHAFLGMSARTGPAMLPTTSVEYRTFEKASPVYHVTSDDAAFLLMHGDTDNVVPIKHSELMDAALRKAGVQVKMLRVVGGGHGPTFQGVKDPPDYLGEMVRWFNVHLASR